jgi:HEPN domain-containing protein
MDPEPEAEWIRHAEDDERVVDLIRNARGPWNLGIYHLHQAAEKRIKAELIRSGINPPRSHDLVYLLGLFGDREVPQQILDDAATASAAGWMSRYPGGPTLTFNQFETVEASVIRIRSWLSNSPSEQF